MRDGELCGSNFRANIRKTNGPSGDWGVPLCFVNMAKEDFLRWQQIEQLL